MKITLKIFIAILLSIGIRQNLIGQIGDIKGLADGAGELFSGCSGSDLSAGCMFMDCCYNGGLFFVEFLVDHHKEIMNMKYLDPTLLSVEMNGNFAYALHFSHDSLFTYINYLPQIRGNLGVFSTDFRFNMLTEYTNDFPDSFKSWELLFLINVAPAESFRLTLGTGVYSELFTESYYNENYLEFKFLMPNKSDFLDLDTRVVIDYNTSRIPFLEAGIRYNTRIIDFSHVYAYLSLGAMYQNYYTSHDIWAARCGIMFNFH